MSKLPVLHMITYSRRPLGHSPVSGRRLYGYKLTCACGWTAKANGNKRYAESIARDHINHADGPEEA